MNISEKYYIKNLYPFQDGVMNIVGELNTPFYLTGGTALGRHYFNHRHSDDLDLFVNDNNNYISLVKKILQKFEEEQARGIFIIKYNQLRTTENFTQIFLVKKIKGNEIFLKVDLINDVAKHYGKFEENKLLGRIDSWRNILSNKLSALFRFEAKDVVDIWIIAKNRPFNWKNIINEAKTKEAGIDPIVLHRILTSFPINELNNIKWAIKFNKNIVLKDLKIIAEDILKGCNNSLI